MMHTYWVTPHDQRNYNPHHLTAAERCAEAQLFRAVDAAEWQWLAALGADEVPSPSDPTPIQAAALWAETEAGRKVFAQAPGGLLFAALGWRVLQFTLDARQCYVAGIPLALEVVGIGEGNGPINHGVVLVFWHNWAQATLDIRFIPVPPEFSEGVEDDCEWSTWGHHRF